jgi:hypothetical protein
MTTMTPARRLKNILGGSAGNFVEWFDWFAYSAFAIYFSRAFFPAGDQTARRPSSLSASLRDPWVRCCSVRMPTAPVVVRHSPCRWR